MKVGLISDVHGNAAALEAVLDQLSVRTDQVYFLGDLAGYYPFVNECVQLWDRAAITGIRGNHDEVMLQAIAASCPPPEDYSRRYGSALERAWSGLSPKAEALFKSLPVTEEIEVGGRTIALFHGAPWDPLEGRVYPDFDDWSRFDSYNADVVLLGHTHYQFVRRLRDRVIVNPGSVGQPRDCSGVACYAVMDLLTDDVELCKVTYDPSPVVADAQAHDPGIAYLWQVLSR